MSDFFAMGGYGLFVWGSFAAFASVLAWNIWAPKARRGEVFRRLVEDEDGNNAVTGARGD